MKAGPETQIGGRTTRRRFQGYKSHVDGKPLILLRRRLQATSHALRLPASYEHSTRMAELERRAARDQQTTHAQLLDTAATPDQHDTVFTSSNEEILTSAAKMAALHKQRRTDVDKLQCVMSPPRTSTTLCGRLATTTNFQHCHVIRQIRVYNLTVNKRSFALQQSRISDHANKQFHSCCQIDRYDILR